MVAVAAPFLRILDAIGPVFSNNLAAVIVKPSLPVEVFPWLEPQGDHFVARRAWFANKFGTSDA
jgi:hypothetical protein